MSHDDYHHPLSTEQADFFNSSHLDPRNSYYPTTNSHYDPAGRRSRASSNTRSEYNIDSSRYPSSRQPINEAVTNEFNKTDAPGYVSPELINQITETVIKQLTSLDGAAPIAQPQPMAADHPIYPPSTSGSSPKMPTRNYTPPSPRPRTEERGRRTSPSAQSKGTSTLHVPSEYTQSSQPERRGVSPARGQPGDIGQNSVRPKGPPRLSTTNDATTLEKIWGALFDLDGNATPRLGQFLRGLAVHIIEDFEPRHSIVVTPSKLQKYYQQTRLSSEQYPWQDVFDDHSSSISRMFRELECSHHLIQERPSERPDIPGLTPVGFERWVTLLIQAYPEQEYERLTKAVLDMPISNPDDKKERFPKEISKRLFPTGPDHEVRARIKHAIDEHANLESMTTPMPTPTPKPAQQETNSHYHTDTTVHSPPASKRIPTPLERERQPYSNSQPPSEPSEASLEDSNMSAKPIERERKPYVGKEGSGKIYDSTLKPAPTAKHARSNSTATRARPVVINETNHRHTGSASTASTGGRRRVHSPPPSSDYRRSDGDLLYGSTYPTSYATETSFDDPYTRETTTTSRRPYDEDPRIYDSPAPYDYSARGALSGDEDYYRSAGRGTTGSGYDYTQNYPPRYS
ncbi:MAG: hypothetical protein M1834_002958 [Cirrosporium novae-zelandiae]|nr:MAG: hypothetical protein M1834_002958 [Cirrosporium novae-zelandiae]